MNRGSSGVEPWSRNAVTGLVVVSLCALGGLGFSEVTGASQASRPFLLIGVLLASWLAGPAGGVAGTLAAAIFFVTYSTDDSLSPSLSGEDVWTFVAFMVAAVLITVINAERNRVERALRAVSAALREANAAQDQFLRRARESESRYRQLADAMPQLVWTATSDGQVTYYNARAAEYAVTLTDAAPGEWSWRTFVHPDDLEGTLAAWNAAVAEHRLYQYEHRIRMKDGAYRWHMSRAVPVRDEDTVIWYGTATDIEALHEALAAKDQFLALVSHDLRSPLTTILGNAVLLRRGVIQTPEDVLAAARDIEQQANRLAETIEDLIDLARVTDATPGALEAIPVTILLTTAIENLGSLTPPRLHLNIESEDAVVQANQRYVDRIIHNMVSNAVKYGSPDLPIEINAGAADGMMEIRVCDRGIGISGDPERLFEPFYRAPGAAQTSPGLGIGLTLCKRLVQAQRGEIGARARPGGGSVFWFRLRLEQTTGPVD